MDVRITYCRPLFVIMLEQGVSTVVFLNTGSVASRHAATMTEDDSLGPLSQETGDTVVYCYLCTQTVPNGDIHVWRGQKFDGKCCRGLKAQDKSLSSHQRSKAINNSKINIEVDALSITHYLLQSPAVFSVIQTQHQHDYILNVDAFM